MGQAAKRTRVNRTITVDFQHEATYFQLLDDGKAFLEFVFAFLLAVAMVGGLATLRLIPLGPRHELDLYSIVFWFAAYKIGIFALVTITPRATRGIFLAALGIDPSRITTISYGKERPEALGSDEAAWAQNRRAVTVTID